MKKMLLAALMLLMLPLAMMADAVQVDGIYYNLDATNQTAEVTKNPQKYTGAIVIPDQITVGDKDYPVTAIGRQAFYFNTGLTAITIPASVKEIPYSVLAGCTGLTSIVVEEGNTTYDSRGGCNAIIETANNALLCGCKTTVIPNSVEEILYQAFYAQRTMQSITFPASVKTIQPAAFQGCGLTSLTIPATLLNIFDNPFRDCSSLTSIVVDSENRNLDSRDGCNAVIRKYSNELLVDCRSTVIPSSVTGLGSYTFAYRNDFETFDVPEQITYIGNSVLTDCYYLKTVTLPDAVEEIDRYAFSYCSNLTTLKIGKGLKKITGQILMYDERLTDIYIDATSVPKVDENAFDRIFNNVSNLSNVKLHVPASAAEAYRNDPAWGKFTIETTEGGSYEGITSTFNGTQSVDTGSTGTTKYADLYSEEGNTWWGVFFSAPSDTPFGFTNYSDESCIMMGDPTSPTTLDVLLENSQFQVNGPIKKVIVRAAGNMQHIGSELMVLEGTEGNVMNWKAQEEEYKEVTNHTDFVDYTFSFQGQEYTDAKVRISLYGQTPAFVHSIIIVQSEDESGSALSGTTGDLTWKAEELNKTVGFWGNNGYEEIPAYRLTISGNGYMGNYDQDLINGQITTNTPWNDLKGITEVVVDEGAISIGTSAFADMRCLETVTLPSTLKFIYYNAFSSSSLSSIDLPEGLQEIHYNAFSWCSSLTSMDIPSTVSKIEPSAFAGNNFQQLTVAQGNTLFESPEGSNAIISKGDNVLVVGTPATVIPATVTEIGNYAFYNNYNLRTKPSIPEGIKTIGDYAFAYSGNLPAIELPHSVTTIGASAFNGCSRLTHVTLGKGVESIGKNVFFNCSAVDSVFCHADPNKLEWTEYSNAKNFKANKATCFLVTPSSLQAWQQNFADLNVTFLGELPGDEQPEPATIAFVFGNEVSKSMELKHNVAQSFTSPTLRVSPEGRTLVWRTNISEKPVEGQKAIKVEIATNPFEVKLLNADGTGQTDVSVVVYDEYVTALATLNISFYAETYEEPAAPEVEPVTKQTTIIFDTSGDDAITDETDLTNTQVGGMLFTLNQDSGDGYDSGDKSIVLNSEMSTEEVEAVLEQLEPGTGAFAAMFSGMTFKLPAGSGYFNIDFLTMGNRVLSVKIGDNAVLTFTQNEQGSVKVEYECEKETYVYIYGSSAAAAAAPSRSLVFRKQTPRKASASSNAVKIYGFEIVPQQVITGIEQATSATRPASAQWYTIDGRLLNSKPTQKGIYVNGGRKVIIK
jgi:hypothetical protein